MSRLTSDESLATLLGGYCDDRAQLLKMAEAARKGKPCGDQTQSRSRGRKALRRTGAPEVAKAARRSSVQASGM